MIRRIIDFLLDLLFPRECPVCGNIVIPKGKDICDLCKNEFVQIQSPYCLKCGKPLSDDGIEYCIGCREKSHDFDEGRAAFLYNDAMRKSIYRFKYNNKSEYARYYGLAISEILGNKIKSYNADALIPVPMYKRKERKRGYNQAYLIAKEISRQIDVPVKADVVIRKRSTKIMRSLGAKEREKNIKKAFKLRKDSVKLNNVVIVDDIYTTGATADAVAASLKAGGVKKVYIIALATGKID